MLRFLLLVISGINSPQFLIFRILNLQKFLLLLVRVFDRQVNDFALQRKIVSSRFFHRLARRVLIARHCRIRAFHCG